MAFFTAITDSADIKQKMLHWAQSSSIFCFLDSAGYQQPHGRYECLLAVGAAAVCSSENSSLDQLSSFVTNAPWVFGHFSYEAKNLLYPAKTQKGKDYLQFPLFYFFKPQHVLALTHEGLHIYGSGAADVFAQVMATQPVLLTGSPPVTAHPLQTKEVYLQTVKALQNHIHRGDCYEINYCQQYLAHDVTLQPLHCFTQLVQQSPTPFAALYRTNNCHLISCSPERFLKREEDHIWSQPMKGTAVRDVTNPYTDEAQKAALQASEKDKAENVMVVDMVRNDLSRICIPGSVAVEDLFGVYSFPKVHQMVSTVKGKLQPGTSFKEIIEATFPMGSMTGAPKHRVMELIDQYEPAPRGLFSGTIGYLRHNDFDFNVVIRSILYNSALRKLSYGIGSGITAYSNPDSEWEECMIKGAAIRSVLSGSKSK